MYDAVIIGGGLAGLVCALELGEAYKVLLIEKEEYPFHKVCGEYISNESRIILESYGLPFEEWNLPLINKLKISDPSGKLINSKLGLGGFGISRFALDNFLFEKLKALGVEVRLNERVEALTFINDQFEIQTDKGKYQSKLAIGSYGKRDKLDKQLNRKFIKKRTPYLAVKYHVKNKNTAADTIALHNFEGGYLGSSRIEDDRVCICYLGSSKDLKKHSSILEMEKQVLFKNPHIKSLFEESEFLYKEPLVISQISFEKKSQVENHVFMVGDSAGLITPLCGNGMSMAIHGAVHLSGILGLYLEGEFSREDTEWYYQTSWNSMFGTRLKAGRLIQSAFGASWKTKLFLDLIRPFPSLQSLLIRLTHGKEIH